MGLVTAVPLAPGTPQFGFLFHFPICKMEGRVHSECQVESCVVAPVSIVDIAKSSEGSLPLTAVFAAMPKVTTKNQK